MSERITPEDIGIRDYPLAPQLIYCLTTRKSDAYFFGNQDRLEELVRALNAYNPTLDFVLVDLRPPEINKDDIFKQMRIGIDPASGLVDSYCGNRNVRGVTTPPYYVILGFAEYFERELAKIKRSFKSNRNKPPLEGIAWSLKFLEKRAKMMVCSGQGRETSVSHLIQAGRNAGSYFLPEFILDFSPMAVLSDTDPDD